MAMKINAGEVGRQDLFSVFPEHIQLGTNGRQTPHTTEQVKTLAKNILEHTQLQPVVVRRIEDHKLQLVAGFGRYAAVQYINTVLQPDNPIKLQCKVVECSPEEAFVRNLTENLQRADTTPIDDAHNQRLLREQFGWSEKKIAEFYQQTVSYIGQLRKTLSLPKEIQEKVKDKENPLPISVAIALTELPAAQQTTVMAAATDTNGKVDSNVVHKAVREKKIANGSGKFRTTKELKDFFQQLTNPTETVATRTLCAALVEFVSGKITDRQMEDVINAHNCQHMEEFAS